MYIANCVDSILDYNAKFTCVQIDHAFLAVMIGH